MTGETASASIDVFPEECLAKILGHLEASDVAACQQASKMFISAAKSPDAWLSRLEKTYNIRVQTTNKGRVDWPALYRDVTQCPASGSVRFRGVFTDGGCDEGLMQFWVDNMWAPNHWESYCSAVGSNITTLALLLGGPVPVDVREAEHRAYLISRCRIPAQVVYGNVPPFWGGQGMNGNQASRPPPRIEAWSTSELEHFMLTLYNQLQEGQEVGRLLLVGMKSSEISAGLAKLRAVCESLPVRHDERLSDLIRAPANEHVMMDAGALPLLRSPTNNSHNQIAVVDRVYISRAGHFSCPLRSCVVFLGSFRRALGAAPDGAIKGTPEEVLARLQAAANEAVCKAFDGVSSRAALAELETAAQEGLVPRPIAFGGTAGGEWLEFDPDWQPPGGGCASLRPVAWVHFYSRAEAEAARERLGASDNYLRRFPTAQRYDALSWPTDTPAQQPGDESTTDKNVASSDDAAPMSQPAAELEAAAAEETGAAAEGQEAGGQEAAEPQQEADDGDEGAAGGLEAAAEEGVAEAAQGQQEEDGGFQLEPFEDPQLFPLQVNGDESDGDEDMVDVPQGGNAQPQGPQAAAGPAAGFGMVVGDGQQHLRSTEGRNRMEVILTRRHCGNMAAVKLIDSEDLMAPWHDMHSEPNIDVAAVAFRGRCFTLPETLRLA